MSRVPTMSATTPASLRLLGPFRLLVDGCEIVGLPRKALALLAYLALLPGRRVSREVLADLLWTDSSHEQARHSLRQLLVVLRRTPAGALVSSDGDKVWVDAGAVLVDALLVEAELEEGSAEALERAASCVSGALLEDLPSVSPGFEEWLQPQRARLTRIVARTLRRLAEAQIDAGAIAAAAATAARLVAMDPLDEPAHRLLIQCLSRTGQRSEALQQFERCVRILREELDVAPDAETVALAAQIRAGEGFRGRPVAALPCEAESSPVEGASSAGEPEAVAVSAVPPASVVSVSAAPALAPSRRPLAARLALAAAVAGLIVISAGAYALWPSPRLAPAIAVARFHNVTGSAGQDAADAGFADLVKLRLASVQQMRLADDTRADPGGAAAPGAVEHGARPRYVLEGTVAFDTAVMHVTARLADQNDGNELWSDRYDLPTADAARVADDIASHAARAVSPNHDIRVTGQPPPLADPRRAARELDALGFQMDYYRSATDIRVQRLYLLALTFDQNDVSALTHLATTYIRAAAGRGETDDASLAQADAVLARAIELDPRNAFVLYNTCLLRRLQGRVAEAVALCTRALDIDPRFPPALRELGHDLLEAGDAAQAIASYRAAIEAGPYLPLACNAFKGLGVALWAVGLREEAIAALQQSAKLDATHDDDEQLWLAALLEVGGKHAEAGQLMAEFMARHPGLRIDAGYLRLLRAPVYAARRNEVLAALAQTMAFQTDSGAGANPAP